MKHAYLVRGVRIISRTKGCALCRTLAAIREIRNRQYQIPKAEEYDQHFLNEDGTLILPQIPYHDCGEYAKKHVRLLPIHLGSQPDLANKDCNFVLLVHSKQPQLNNESLHTCSEGIEVPDTWVWDHVFALLPYRMAALSAWRSLSSRLKTGLKLRNPMTEVLLSLYNKGNYVLRLPYLFPCDIRVD
jgi:hypothetical protein